METPTRRGRPPKPSRVSWAALARLVDNSDRSPLHSGRPGVEQTPALQIRPLLRQGAADGVILDLRAIDGPVRVTVHVKLDLDHRLARLRWVYKPDIGAETTRSLEVKLRPIANPCGQWFSANCPHCGRGCQQLLWAVHTWSCRQCLGLSYESHRLGPLYKLEKQARLLRLRLGLDPTPLAPILVKIKRHAPIAERLWKIELELMARIAARKIG